MLLCIYVCNDCILYMSLTYVLQSSNPGTVHVTGKKFRCNSFKIATNA